MDKGHDMVAVELQKDQTRIPVEKTPDSTHCLLQEPKRESKSCTSTVLVANTSEHLQWETNGKTREPPENTRPELFQQSSGHNTKKRRRQKGGRLTEMHWKGHRRQNQVASHLLSARERD
ncbi:hypothetical protein YC2023_022780 [Brassica napus]